MSSTLETLFATIAACKQSSPESSYTARLLAMGENEICKKIGEEAIEVIVAAKCATHDRIIYDMADWVYHAMVLLAYSAGHVSYAGAIREVSVVFAALICWRWLGEGFGALRVTGALLIFGGTLVIAIAG